jgi:hypothetical protein
MTTTYHEDNIIVSTDIHTIPREYFAGQDTSMLISDEPVEFDIKRFELVPGVGALTYIGNATHPRKGLPAMDIIYAINIFKEIIKQATRYPLLFLSNNVKLLISFNDIFLRCMAPYKLNHIYLCNTARMVWYATSTFLQGIGIDKGLANNVGYNFAHIIEIDDAYRHRLEDMMTECYKDRLSTNPQKEVKRLFRILGKREWATYVVPKIGRFVNLLSLMLYIPKYKKAFLGTLPYLEKIRYDESDWYWVAFKDNYKFGGCTHDERLLNVEVPNMYKRIK